jgi:presenilin-like A22 family membrane protease
MLCTNFISKYKTTYFIKVIQAQISMKHDWRITALLVTIFFISQLVGLHIISQYVDIEQTAATGKTVVNAENYVIAPPEVENENWSWIPIVLAVLIGTGMVLLIAKFRLFAFWKIWFFLSVLIALFHAFSPYVFEFFQKVYPLSYTSSFVVTLVFAAYVGWLKMASNDIFIHNLSEIFIYGGIAALFVPWLNVTAAIVLLIFIALYDAYAVYKSKHMIDLATFQAESRLFAGLFIPKTTQAISKPVALKPSKQGKSTHAILGGGDIAFPMLFTGSVLKYTNDFGAALIITVCATIALLILFMLSREGKFYPAMPAISAGCFVGLALVSI